MLDCAKASRLAILGNLACGSARGSVFMAGMTVLTLDFPEGNFDCFLIAGLLCATNRSFLLVSLL